MSDFGWYVVITFVGQEQRVASAILDSAKKAGLSALFSGVEIPTQPSKDPRYIKKVMPGYVFVKMALDDRAFSMVKSLKGVSKFLGPASSPSEVPQSQLDSMFNSISTYSDAEIMEYRIGDTVLITCGPFDGFVGQVESVDNEVESLRVLVSIFGRDIPVELGFSGVRRDSDGSY
jgi:transcriptional antiterminator NusG